ncbi:MAG TPA: pyridoxamine 5'-phosphate oxidase [Alphaproteobacteria bacterium]|nr:pyridoxamine 5'-phosphate oxidase [Alphaproteobacteria bacterium]
MVLFHDWLREAKDKEENDPTAACLATASADAIPSARMVLLKDANSDGFVFYTNLESRKGEDLLRNPQAALCFHWKSLRRQVRIEGNVTLVSATEGNEYFATRPRSAQIGAWASSQSKPLQTRFHLEKRVVEYTAKFGLSAIPRPEHWSGYRVAPKRIEFWRHGNFRLHDRLLYERNDTGWRREWLFP